MAKEDEAEETSVGLQILGGVLIVLDLLVWILTLGPIWMILEMSSRKSTDKLGDRAIKADELEVNGPGKPKSQVFRHPCAADKRNMITQPMTGLTTVWEIFEYSYKTFADDKALGTRTLQRLDRTMHPKFPTKVFGETQWLSYAECGDKARNFGKGLIALGMESLNMKPGDKFDDQKGPFTMLLYENSCAEWFLAMQGAFSQSIVVSTAYATLGVDAVVAAVQEGEMVTVFCNKASVKMLAEKAKDMPTLKNIIYTFDMCEADERITKAPGHPGLNIISFDEVVEKGKQASKTTTPPRPHDVAILMYTSGSTGKPKGVIIKHSQMVAVGGGVLNQVQPGRGSYVAYLPLAHIFEMVLEMGMFFLGSTIGYADPKTLTAAPGQCSPTGALEEFKPTLLCGVPKVWETIKTKGDAKIEKSSKIVKFLFKTAFEAKSKAVESGRYCPLFDLLVFKKFKAMTGGQLRLAVSGGGAISGQVQEWIRTCMGCPMVQGYGLTETCLGLTVQMLDDYRLGVVGSPIGSLEYLVHSEPDVCDAEGKPYLAHDRYGADGVPCLGRGEVWVRGHNVTSGYYKMPEQTKEAFRDDGFFMTGDIGMVLPDGSLKIIDRKKNLVKLKGGEYVALEKMNGAFNNSPFVNKENGGSCAYADDSLDRPVALVQADEQAIMAKAKELGVSGDFPTVCKDAKIRKAVLDSLNAEGKKVGLSSLEVLAGVGLLTKPWTPEDGTLTATLKLVVSKVKIVNKAELEEVKPMGRR
eukprot:TRINITY_DN57166_c0_g1_i1.p1 TRINITY_DN57166_c0_g1~~TRINITY_DN57166_c0_g1_i1.p1  ORF type:complete len:772 (+),score=163.23 TRINITY_DN57166_c0_g1_i1:61-2316(+)